MNCKDRLDGRGRNVWGMMLDFGLHFRREKANSLSSKFHLLPRGLCLLFLKIAAKNLVACRLKEDERLHQRITVHITELFHLSLSYFL
jgi:hypothetical protein